nr:DegT/DnrJ/EryC1/StrS family aminotransferase [Candidatus Omnitrophota bacterium]
VAVSSGRAALDMILDSFGLENGDEVMMSAYTLKDLVSLIEAKGLQVRLIDIDPSTFNIDPALIEKNIGPRTRVIIATHIFGMPCDMDRILALAKKYGLKVVEDCAHALGSAYKEKKAGSLSDAAFFSLDTIKPVNTFGGGVITTDEISIYEKIRRVSDLHPHRPRALALKILFSYAEHLIIISPLYPVLVSMLSSNRTGELIKKIYLASHRVTNVKASAFTNIQALMGCRQLKDLDSRNAGRLILAKKMTEAFGDLVFVQRHDHLQNGTFYFFVVKLPDSGFNTKNLRSRLVRRGIDAGVKSEVTDDCSGPENPAGDYLVTKDVYNTAIQLPIHDRMSEKDIHRIAKALREALA